MSGFSLDTREFFSGLKNLDQNVMPELMRKALFAAGSAMIEDANEEIPRTPVREGHLKGSSRPGGGGDPVWESKYTGIGLIVGYDIEYAAYVHEAAEEAQVMPTWTEPGSGPKFLEAKVVRYQDDYFLIMAETIKREGFS